MKQNIPSEWPHTTVALALLAPFEGKHVARLSLIADGGAGDEKLQESEKFQTAEAVALSTEFRITQSHFLDKTIREKHGQTMR